MPIVLVHNIVNGFILERLRGQTARAHTAAQPAEMWAHTAKSVSTSTPNSDRTADERHSSED